MSVTTMANMINPEVMGDMINAKIEAQLKLTPYAKVDTTLVGVPGDTKTVPSWNYIGDAVDVAENSEIDVTQMSASTATFTIKKAGKAIAITTEAINSGLGNPVGQGESQLAKAIAGKVDNDVLDAVYTGTMIVSPSTLTSIDYNGIVDAVTKFEDEEDGIEKVMFIHPKQETSLLKDANFLSADKFTAGVAVNGSIGKIAGCWIKKSKKVKQIAYEKAESGSITIIAEDGTESSTAKKLSTVQPNCAAVLAVGDKVNSLTAANQYYLNPIIKMEADSAETEYTEDELPAVTIHLKKDTTVTSDYVQRYDRHEIVAYRYYGVSLTNAAKVVLAKFKA